MRLNRWPKFFRSRVTVHDISVTNGTFFTSVHPMIMAAWPVTIEVALAPETVCLLPSKGTVCLVGAWIEAMFLSLTPRLYPLSIMAKFPGIEELHIDTARLISMCRVYIREKTAPELDLIDTHTVRKLTPLNIYSEKTFKSVLMQASYEGISLTMLASETPQAMDMLDKFKDDIIIHEGRVYSNTPIRHIPTFELDNHTSNINL
jgi:hypothetical protein